MLTTRNSLVRLFPALFVLTLALAACGTDGSNDDSDSNQIGAQPTATIETPSSVPTAADSSVDEQPASDPGDAPAPTVNSEPTAEESAAAVPDPTATPVPVDEPEDPAPGLGSIDSWHNSPPLTLAELRGSPVLLVFWADF
ncbi:MAG: hypothetical protein R2849_05675 [Thermomicrobiales bacterium]